MREDQYVWVIRGGLTDEKFPTEEEAIARSWELTAPGKDRWIVDRKLVEPKRVPTAFDKLGNDLFKVKPKRDLYLIGAVMRGDQLTDLVEHSIETGMVILEGGVVWIKREGMFVVLRRQLNGDLDWEKLPTDDIDLDLLSQIQTTAEKERW